MAAKMDYDALRQAIAAGDIAPLYVFYGEESYLREDTLRRLKKALVPDGFDEFNFHRFEGREMTAQQLAEAVEAMPMMAERTLTVVTDCDLFGLPEAERTAIIALLEDLPEYSCLVFVYDTLEYKPNKTYKKLCDALAKHAQSVCFTAQEKGRLIRWITNHFQAAGHTVSPTTCEHLIFTCGDLMTGLAPEIDKIAAYAKGKEVTVADVDAIADPVLDAAVFNMTNAITAGNYDRAAEQLGQLLKQQEEPLVLLGAIAKELRRIYTARIALDSGKDKLWLMSLWGMKSDYPAKLLLAAARRTTREWCAESLRACLKLDRRFKYANIDRETKEADLKLLLMQLAQRK